MYFINPSPATRAPLAAKKGDSAALAAAFHTIRRSTDTGTLRVRLTDGAGTAYGVGYATPPGMTRDTLYPLIIYLHGGTGTECIDKGDSAFLMLAPLADTFRLFLASPSANRFTPWWSPAGLSRILQTLRFMTLHYPVDPRKVFLAGVSDGATGCFAAANTIPAPFAGFIAVSGFGGMLSTLGMRLEPGNLKQRPIYNVNAGLDHLYPIEMVKEFVRLLQERGVAITSKIYPDEKHGFDYRAQEMGALAACVRAWSLPERGAISWTFVRGVPNLPDNIIAWTLSSDNASIRAFWRRDTLVVRGKGIKSLTVELPNMPEEETFVFKLSSGGKKYRIRTLAPMTVRWPQNLEFMVNRCFPGPCDNVYNIIF